MPAGRPSEYTAELGALICERIAEGQSMREIARADDMPAMSTMFLWISKHAQFSERYAQAKQSQAEHMAEDLLDIVDDGTNDWMERKNQDGSTTMVLNGEHVQRSRLRADTRKWLISKLLPKKYGDKLEVGGSGPNGSILVKFDADDEKV